jgi:Flp pilus assembly pilin Flp
MGRARVAPTSPLGQAEGATAVEYAVIAGALAAVVVGVALVLGGLTTETLCAPLEQLKSVGVAVDIDC